MITELRIVECSYGYRLEAKRKFLWWSYWSGYYSGEYSTSEYETMEEAKDAMEYAKASILRKKQRRIHKHETF